MESESFALLVIVSLAHLSWRARRRSRGGEMMHLFVKNVTRKSFVVFLNGSNGRFLHPRNVWGATNALSKVLGKNVERIVFR